MQLDATQIIVAIIALAGTIGASAIAYRKAGQASADAKTAQESMPILKGFESVIKTLENENARLNTVVERLEGIIDELKKQRELDQKQIKGLEVERDGVKQTVIRQESTIDSLRKAKDTLERKLKKAGFNEKPAR